MRADRMGFTLSSTNGKTGPIPVSTSRNCTCPKECPFKKEGCYARTGPVSIWWKKLNNGAWGMTWRRFLDNVRRLPKGTFWRHAQAGDLPGRGSVVDRKKLLELADANRGKLGYTYTHKPPNRGNLSAIREALARGFTTNLSANGPSMADRLFDLGLPTVTIVETGTPRVSFTPKKRRIIICPAQLNDDMTCYRCRLCARAKRNFIIGFLPHGSQARAVNTIAAVS